MTRPYGRLALGLLVAGLALGVLARLPRATPPPAVPAPARRVSLVLTIGTDGSLEPPRSAVAKGEEVTLVVGNEGGETKIVELSGYEERVRLRIPPGSTRRAVFLADRPGEGFAWIVDGSPQGRFVVTGPHLVEGHE